MKLIAALLLALLATPVVAQEKLLTHEEILAQVDDATAAELRWILRAPYFRHATGSPFGDDDRAALAFDRIVAADNPNTFETMLKAQDDLTVLYGIEGMSRVSKARLLPHLPRLVLRHRNIMTAHNGVVVDTNVLEELWQALRELPANEVEPYAKGAFATLVKAMSEQQGDLDPYHLGYLCEWAGMPETPDPAASTEVHQVYQFMALRKANDFVERARDEGSRPGVPVLRTLCVRQIGGLIQDDLNDTLEAIWSRELRAEHILDLEASAHYWSQCIHWLDTRDPLASVLVKYDCAWQALTAADWDWLCAHQDQLAAKMAQQLRNNPISGWSLDRKPKAGTFERGVWLRCASVAAMRGDIASLRARILLAQAAKERPGDLCFGFDWDIQNSVGALSTALGDEQTLTLAVQALNSEDEHDQTAGVVLVACLANQEEPPPALSATGSLKMRLLELMNRDHKDWATRIRLARLVSKLFVEEDADAKAVLQASLGRWLRALIVPVAADPRRIPSVLHELEFVLEMLEFAPSRVAAMFAGTFGPEQYFVPIDEQPKDDEHRNDDVPLQTLHMRLRAALMKLDE